MSAKLDHIVITVADYARALRVYQAICGGEPHVHVADDGTARYTRFYLGDSVVELAEPLGAPDHGAGRALSQRLLRSGPGVHLVCLPASDLEETAAALEAGGATLIRGNGHVYVHPKSASGVLVQLTPRREFGPRPREGDARFDHVAIAVNDLAAASARWATITGTAAQLMGVHPISNGAFQAARFVLGAQMVELISPVAGVASPLAARLASRGEGVAALALPANRMDATLSRLRAAEARLLEQPPHWMVHPKDASGVLVQITPRVAH
ncbi:MAG: VOC family protein [Burkholderiales bacterium]